MNTPRNTHDSFRTLQLMNELEENSDISQRELASRLGVAVGLINLYLKNLAAKGFLRVKNYPRNRYAYLLTPKGFAEKSRLAYQHLSYFNNLFTVVRQDYVNLFKSLYEQNCRTVVFCGVDEVTEIAYLSMQEVGLQINAVTDVSRTGTVFFGHVIEPMQGLDPGDAIPIVVTSKKREELLLESLLQYGIDRGRIYTLGGS